MPKDTDNFLAARITLSDNATGRWIYSASSINEYTVIAPVGQPVWFADVPVVWSGTGSIRTGELRLVPEPSTAGLLLVLGALSMCCRALRRLTLSGS